MIFGIKSLIIISAFFGIITFSLYILSGEKESYLTYSSVYLFVLTLYLIFFVKLFVFKDSYLTVWTVFKKRNINKDKITKVVLLKNTNRGGLDQIKFVFDEGSENIFHTKMLYFEINNFYQYLIAQNIPAELING